MGYGDVFVAGVLGGVLAAEAPSVAGRDPRVRALRAVGFLFLLDSINTLPATVPIAAALLFVEAHSWITRRRPGFSPAN